VHLLTVPCTENYGGNPRIVVTAMGGNCEQIANMRIQNSLKQTEPTCAKLLKSPNNLKQHE
jgi:hypothetical protein